MQTALNLAELGLGSVAPNPMVGCVIVYKNEIVAQGYHQKYGETHAEVNAINNLNVNINPKNCTLYVTLEPCSHFGKTPPCADLIIEKGFNKVVVCNLDSNPLVAGKGIKKLKNAGIEVIIGILEDFGNELNKRFFAFHKFKRPYIILKWAETNDGFISKLPLPINKQQNWITGNEAQQLSHLWRTQEQAILVGKNTVLADNPSLTARLVKGNNPIRIVIDKNLELNATLNIFNTDAKTIIFNSVKNEIKNNLTYIKLNFNKYVAEQVLDKLYALNIQSIIVEGGTLTLNSFLQNDFFDELRIFKNPNLNFINGLKAPNIELKIEFQFVGGDILFLIDKKNI